MKLAAKIGIATASVALSFTAVGVNSAHAVSLGSNWTLTNTNADGSVDASNVPSQIKLTGGNNGSFNPGQTSYTTTSDASGQLSFSWNYSTPDYQSSYDPFRFVLNGTTTDILNNSQDTGSGTFTSPIAVGDVFGFLIGTQDNSGGAGSVTVSNFGVTPVPEPSEVGGSVLAVGMGWLIKRKLVSSRRYVK